MWHHGETRLSSEIMKSKEINTFMHIAKFFKILIKMFFLEEQSICVCLGWGEGGKHLLCPFKTYSCEDFYIKPLIEGTQTSICYFQILYSFDVLMATFSLILS